MEQDLLNLARQIYPQVKSELEKRGQLNRELSDKDLTNILKTVPETANRLEQITDNVLRPADREGKPSLIKDYPIGELEMFENFAKPVGSSGIEDVLFNMVLPVGKAKKIANAPKFLQDLYEKRALYTQMVEDSLRSLRSIMGPTKGKTKSDDLFTRVQADDFNLIERQRVMDTAYKASRRRDELAGIEKQIKTAEKLLGSSTVTARKPDMAEEVGKRFMRKSEFASGGIIDALNKLR